MSTTRILFTVPLACLALLLGCESPRPRPRPRSRTQQAKAVTVTVKGDQQQGSRQVRLQPGQVIFSVENADLATQVLPIFKEQAGVQIHWKGPQRRLTLRLSHPLAWTEALDLVCQFTKTHATRDWQGRWVLKDGWSGRPTSETIADLTGDPSDRDRGSGGSAYSGRVSGTGYGGGSNPPSGAQPNPTPFGSAYSGGADAKRILQGTTTTQAGR